MSLENNILPNSSSSANSEFFHNIFDAYANFLNKKKEELDFSKLMLSTGAKTELTVGFENMAKDPIGEMFQIGSKLDEMVKSVIDKMVSGYLLSKGDFIKNAFKTETYNNDLHYCIILKEDTTELRNEMYSFLSGYELIEHSQKFPIYFQFVPENLEIAIPIKEEIITHAGASK